MVRWRRRPEPRSDSLHLDDFRQQRTVSRVPFGVPVEDRSIKLGRWRTARTAPSRPPSSAHAARGGCAGADGARHAAAPCRRARDRTPRRRAARRRALARAHTIQHAQACTMGRGPCTAHTPDLVSYVGIRVCVIHGRRPRAPPGRGRGRSRYPVWRRGECVRWPVARACGVRTRGTLCAAGASRVGMRSHHILAWANSGFSMN